MEELGQFIVNNGLGVASFFVLVWFMFNYVTKINDTLGKICSTLESVERTLNDMTNRVDKLEETKKKRK